MKENRKIEDLILMFATTATAVLRKDPQLADDGWKVELNNQISHFIKVLRECLKGMGHVPPELTARLDTYDSKLTPQSSRQSLYDTQGQSSRGESSSSAGNIEDIPLAKTVVGLFGKNLNDGQKDINALKRTCTEKVRRVPSRP